MPNLIPLPAAYIVLLPVILLLVLLFIRTDMITTLTAMVTLGVLHHGLMLVLPWNSGFFTDGYPEAMTRKRGEFGEERMFTALAQYEGNNAWDILTHMHGQIRSFTGRAKQHDDMTMVVARIRMDRS